MSNETIQHVATVSPIDHEVLKPHPTLHRRRSIIRDFSLNAGAHGVPNIARSESIRNRIFWIVAFLGFAGAMMYFIILSIIAYLAYPTQTSVTVVVQRSQPFPAFSVCNFSPIRFDLFIDPFLNYINSRNLTNTTDNTTITSNQAKYMRDFFQYHFNAHDNVSQYLFSLESMLIACEYNGQACNTSDFIPFLSSAHGLCYTFNAKMKSNQSRLRMTTDDGGGGRLILSLYTQSYQYVPYVSDDVSSGMVGMIHDNDELPLIEVAGVLFAPGRRHRLAFRKRTYQLLSAPFTQCTETISPVMHKMFDQYQGADYSYSQVLCNTLCVQAYVYHECQCIDPLEWTARAVADPVTGETIIAPLCNISVTCYTDAMTQISTTSSIWDQYCSDCNEECFTVQFTSTPSSVSSLAEPFLDSAKAFAESSKVPLPQDWSTRWQEYVKQNSLSIDVILETTRVEMYDQDASITGVDLVSNIGGNTGLWIGISFLSLMEVVEMLYRLIRYQIYVLRNRLQMNNQEKIEVPQSFL